MVSVNLEIIPHVLTLQRLAVLFDVGISTLPHRFIPAWYERLKQAGIALPI